MKSNILSVETKKKLIDAIEEAIVECGLQHTFNIVDQDSSTQPYKTQPVKAKILLTFEFPGSKNQILCQPEIDL